MFRQSNNLNKHTAPALGLTQQNTGHCFLGIVPLLIQANYFSHSAIYN